MERRLARIERVLYAVVGAIVVSGGMSSLEFARLVAMLAEMGSR
jgi:hypothetical protein